MKYEAPRILDYGSISAHTFMPTPPGGPNAGNGNHKGFRELPYRNDEL